MMKKITPAFRDDKDKLVTLAVILLSLFLAFVPALIVIVFMKDKISVSSYEIAKAFFNFELLLFIIALLFAIPVIGWILGLIGAPIICILNLIVVIVALCALANNKEIKIPIGYEFI